MSVHVEEHAEGMDKGSSLKFCINNRVSQKFELGNLDERANKAFNMLSPNRRAQNFHFYLSGKSEIKTQMSYLL